MIILTEANRVTMWLSLLPRFMPSSRREMIILLHLLCVLPGKWISKRKKKVFFSNTFLRMRELLSSLNRHENNLTGGNWQK